jgi:hypothetical protein
MARPIRNSILGHRKPKPAENLAVLYRPSAPGRRAVMAASLVVSDPSVHPAGAPAAQHSARTRFPAGYRPPPLTLVSAYPEKSPYGLPPAVLLAAIGAEIGVTICSANRYRSLRDRHRNPSLAPTAPKSGKFIWNPSSRQHERAPL